MAAPNQGLHLTGAAILVSRGLMSLQAAPESELGRSAAGGSWNPLSEASRQVINTTEG